MIRIGERVNFDIVIVGAGTAGCAVAAQLARCTDHSIGIVEAGTRYPAWALHAPLAGLRLRPFWSWRHESVAIPGLAARRVVFPMGRVVGGSSSINAMIAAAGHPDAFDFLADARPSPTPGVDPLRALDDELETLGVPMAPPRHASAFTRAFLSACVERGLSEVARLDGSAAETCGRFRLFQRGGRRWSAAHLLRVALVATHADVDHIQGLAKAKALLKAPILAHPAAVEALESGDRIKTFAEIAAQNVHMEMPAVKVDRTVVDGDEIAVGTRRLRVWHTPGHTDSQLAFRLDDLLLSGDNIYRDGSVGAIDAHHGSDIPSFIRSLERIAASDVGWLLPSHGPIFRRDDVLLTRTIERLRGYLSLADFGTCAPDWPLLEEWDRELAEGFSPGADRGGA